MENPSSPLGPHTHGAPVYSSDEISGMRTGDRAVSPRRASAPGAFINLKAIRFWTAPIATQPLLRMAVIGSFLVIYAKAWGVTYAWHALVRARRLHSAYMINHDCSIECPHRLRYSRNQISRRWLATWLQLSNSSLTQRDLNGPCARLNNNIDYIRKAHLSHISVSLLHATR